MIESKNGLVGLAIGDAMGVPLEFFRREDLINNPVTKMIGEQSHNMPKGTWSDDTSLNLALIDSINKKKKIDLYDIGQNFIDWREKGKYTPAGQMFGIGRTTLKAIAKLEEGKLNPEKCGGVLESDNGNGSLMRILPLVYYCYSKNMSEKEIYEVVRDVSSITHRHEISIMGCFIYVIFGIELLKNNNLEQSNENVKKIKFKEYFSEATINRYDGILKNNIKKYKLDEIKTTGFVVDTLEATLWVLFNTNSYKQAIIGAINLGNDTDTVGACVGGLAGIIYGINTIDESWKNDLIKYEYIVDLCKKFDDTLNNVNE